MLITYITFILKKNLDSVVLLHGLLIASPNLPKRLCKTTKAHIEYILAENVAENKTFVFDNPGKTDHFGSVLFTGISAGNQKSIIFKIFDRKKNHNFLFCKTLSDKPCFKYMSVQMPTIYLTIHVLSSAAESPADLKMLKNCSSP